MFKNLRSNRAFYLLNAFALGVMLINKEWSIDQFNTLLQGIWLASLGFGFMQNFRGRK